MDASVQLNNDQNNQAIGMINAGLNLKMAKSHKTLGATEQQ